MTEALLIMTRRKILGMKAAVARNREIDTKMTRKDGIDTMRGIIIPEIIRNITETFNMTDIGTTGTDTTNLITGKIMITEVTIEIEITGAMIIGRAGTIEMVDIAGIMIGGEIEVLVETRIMIIIAGTTGMKG